MKHSTKKSYWLKALFFAVISACIAAGIIFILGGKLQLLYQQNNFGSVGGAFVGIEVFILLFFWGAFAFLFALCVSGLFTFKYTGRFGLWNAFNGLVCVIMLGFVAWIIYPPLALYNQIRQIEKMNTVALTQTADALLADPKKFSYDDMLLLGAIILNNNASPALLNKIAQLDDQKYQYLLSQHADTLFWFLRGKNKSGDRIFTLVIKNPRTTPATLEKMARTQDMVIISRSKLGANPRLSQDAIIYLYKTYPEDQGGILEDIASNPNTPTDILKKLVTYDSIFIKQAAQKNLNNR